MSPPLRRAEQNQNRCTAATFVAPLIRGADVAARRPYLGVAYRIGLQLRLRTAVLLMIELEEAVGRILALVPPPQPELIPVSAAHQRVPVQDVLSPLDLPGFDNSAMDGYALRAQDVRTATASSPVKLQIAGKIAAGEVFTGEVTAGHCIRLFTGSPLPAGADCVVMQEDVSVEPNNPVEVLVLDSARPWENVRFKGEDVRAGARLAKAGEVVNVGSVCLLAGAGISQVSVGRQPTVGIVPSGSELREPGESLGPGQIYESNRVGLAALSRCAGAKPITFPIVPDTLAATEKALSEAFSKCDLIVSAGGASVGELDLIKPAFLRLGGKLDFWRVAIKPGRPFLCGQLGGKLLFGLPGNPVSALVTFLLLVWPALRRWQGANGAELPGLRGVLTEDLPNPGSRRHFVRVHLGASGAVSLTGTQASHLLSSFAAAQGLVDVPPGTTLPAGASVQVKVWEL